MARTLLVLGGAAAAVAGTLACRTADLRPAALRDLPIPLADPLRGMPAVDRWIEALGGWPAWRAHETADVVLTDEWPGWITRTLFMPWPENGQRLALSLRLGSFDSRLTLVGGERDGHTVGLQAWRTWSLDDAGHPTFDAEPDDELTFWLPTIQYFLELPWRVARAPIVLDAGVAEEDGRRYDLVLVTWDQPEPGRHDQYLLFLDHGSGLLAKVQYTVREMGRWVVGVDHVGDYRRVEGVWIPHRHRLTTDLAGENVLHEFVVESFAFDRTPVEAILVDPDLPRRGDAK